MTPVRSSHSRGTLLGAGLLALLFIGGAVAGIWLSVRDHQARKVLHEVRNHPSNVTFSGQLTWRATLRGEPLELKVDVAHWPDSGSRITLVEVIQAPERMKLMMHMFASRAIQTRGLDRMWSRLLDERLLLRNYQVVIDAGETVAGRQTDSVQVRPLREHRPSLHMLVDRQTRLPLRTTSRGPGGEIQFEMAFETVTFAPPSGPPPVPKESRRRGMEAVTLAQARLDEGRLYVPSRLPAGFELIEVRRRAPKDGKPRNGFVRITYSDGLARLRLMQIDLSQKGRNRNRGQRVPKAPRESQQEGKKPVPDQNRSKTIKHGDRTYEVFDHPPFAVIKTEHRGHKIILVGPVSVDELLDCMSSINWD